MVIYIVHCNSNYYANVIMMTLDECENEEACDMLVVPGNFIVRMIDAIYHSCILYAHLVLLVVVFTLKGQSV